jgi:salicylate hydroxylase
MNGTKSHNGKNGTQSPLTSSIPFTSTSYPSRCLDFLKDVIGQGAFSAPIDTCSSAQAKLKLQIHIVGAGLGGLGTAVALARRGHQVTVFEQASELGEVSTNEASWLQ